MRLMMIVLACSLLLTGCDSKLKTAIASYHNVAPQIELGQPKDHVLAILNPTQQDLPLRQRKAPEQFINKDGVRVEIFFFRSHTFHNGILTDDEFAPYIFHDGKLHAIGWTAIGGPKTQAQPRPETNITVIR
jgi:hypothetical protein